MKILQAMEKDNAEFIKLRYMDILIREGKLDEAVEQFEEIIEMNPRSTKAYLLKGSIDVMRKEYEAAEKAFLLAIEYGEKVFSVYMNLAQLYLSM